MSSVRFSKLRLAVKYLTWLGVVASIFSIQFVSAADIRTEIANKKYAAIFGPVPAFIIEGEIVAGDAERLRSEMADYEGDHSYFVRIASPGGDVAEAIRIGRILRGTSYKVSVTAEGCFSSCVLILAGANVRSIVGPVGVHRPYFSQTVPEDEIEAAYKDMQRTVDGYFQEMNIPGSISEMMFATPPSDTRVLASDELKKYFPKEDPVFEAKRINREAERYGISPAKYRRRLAFANLECGGGYSNCRYAALLGVSLQVYEEWVDECQEWVSMHGKEVGEEGFEILLEDSCAEAVPMPRVE